MSKNILDNLFGSRVRIKVLKFLFRNYPGDFDIKELSKMTQESRAVIKKEVETMRFIGLLKRKK